MIQLEPVEGSSNVYATGHDPATNTMRVQFRASKDKRMPGRIYEYHGIPPKEHEELRNAASVGSHFAQHIKPRYAGRLVSSG